MVVLIAIYVYLVIAIKIVRGKLKMNFIEDYIKLVMRRIEIFIKYVRYLIDSFK